MEEILSNYIVQFGGLGILLLYLYLEGKRKDAKIDALEKSLYERDSAHALRIDAYVEKTMQIFERAQEGRKERGT